MEIEDEFWQDKRVIVTGGGLDFKFICIRDIKNS